MNPQFVTCECGARLKVPQELAKKARTVKCPKCTAAVDISGLSWAEEPVAAMTRPASRPELTPALLDDDVAAPTTKSCVFCGEKVLAEAIKCRHCGEFFDHAKGPRRATAAKVVSGDEPGPAEYFVAVVVPLIGVIIGLIWVAKKQIKGAGMLKASGLSLVIWVVTGLMINFYVFTEESDGVNPAAKNQDLVVIPESTPPPRPPRGSGPGGSGGSPGGVDIEGQPAEIQKAMKANVRLQGRQSLGSGVVIQRMDGDVLILTNHHVVTESTDLNTMPDLKTLGRLRVSYYNEQSNPGTVVWIAPDGIDLALVKAPAPKDIEPVLWIDVPKVLVGQEVFAVGNPLGLDWTFTKGVVSALRQEKHGNRNLNTIQSDTSTTFGNSGGGLYNKSGELIGINSSIADPRMGAKISFAIRPQILSELKPEGLNINANP